MLRREAIQQLLIVGSGLVLLPACDTESIPVFSKLPLEKSEYRLLGQLTQRLLPLEGLTIQTPESTADYILTVVNDCYTQEDIEQFLAGLKGFAAYVIEAGKKDYHRMDEQQQLDALTFLAEDSARTEEMIYFFNQTKHLTVQHFTSSEFFMKNYLEWEFAPARYLGCVEIA
jgi:hypothetical protein